MGLSATITAETKEVERILKGLPKEAMLASNDAVESGMKAMDISVADMAGAMQQHGPWEIGFSVMLCLLLGVFVLRMNILDRRGSVLAVAVPTRDGEAS